MPEPKDFTIHSIDNDFCRINYKAKNADGQTVYYCLQDEGKNYGGVTCYRSSKDLEPDYPIRYNRNRFEVPTGNSDIEVVVRDYLTDKIFEIKEFLSSLKHPHFHYACIDQESVTWVVVCDNCEGIHRISTNTVELDPCCDDPKFTGIFQGE